MLRWTIYYNHIKQGQAFTWHKALVDILLSESTTVFEGEILGHDCVQVKVNNKQFLIKKERI